MGTVERRTWWKGTETRPLGGFFGIVSTIDKTTFFFQKLYKRYTHRETLLVAIFAVNKHEKATNFKLSRELNFVQWKTPNRLKRKHPNDVVVACTAVRSQGYRADCKTALFERVTPKLRAKYSAKQRNFFVDEAWYSCGVSIAAWDSISCCCCCCCCCAKRPTFS